MRPVTEDGTELSSTGVVVVVVNDGLDVVVAGGVVDVLALPLWLVEQLLSMPVMQQSIMPWTILLMETRTYSSMREQGSDLLQAVRGT
jgi:hypothetical protein